jgi:hypothetical protein
LHATKNNSFKSNFQINFNNLNLKTQKNFISFSIIKTLKQTVIPMAVSGHNGNNETFIGLSSSLSLSIYDGENFNELNILANKREPIEVFIDRDYSSTTYEYQYVNVTIDNDRNTNLLYLYNNFNLTSQNASIHIELKMTNSTLTNSIAFIFVLKYGHLPILNATYADYDAFKLICPSRYFF